MENFACGDFQMFIIVLKFNERKHIQLLSSNIAQSGHGVMAAWHVHDRDTFVTK